MHYCLLKAKRDWEEYLMVFLALLCATAQQSYCHASVRRPSVRKTHFLRTCQAD